MNQSDANSIFSPFGSDLYKAQFRVRCPECFKLYSVDWSEIHVAVPHFQCSACPTSFFVDTLKAVSIDSSGVLIGERLPNQTKESPVVAAAAAEPVSLKVFQCPKCSASYAASDKECVSCGLIFSKYADASVKGRAKSEAISASSELKGLWDDLLESYESLPAHQKFVQRAFTESNLEYAIAKYRDILDVVPQDLMAKKAMLMIKEIQNVQFEAVAMAQASPLKKWSDGAYVLEVASVAIKKLRISNLVIILATGLIVFGLVSPSLRNLVGFGSAILAFVLALRFYFRMI